MCEPREMAAGESNLAWLAMRITAYHFGRPEQVSPAVTSLHLGWLPVLTTIARVASDCDGEKT